MAEEEKKLIIKRLQELALWNDKKPSQILSSASKKRASMWRQGFFAMILGYSAEARERQMIQDPETQALIDAASAKWTDPAFQYKPLIEETDVKEAKNFLAKILKAINKI